MILIIIIYKSYALIRFRCRYKYIYIYTLAFSVAHHMYYFIYEIYISYSMVELTKILWRHRNVMGLVFSSTFN